MITAMKRVRVVLLGLFVLAGLMLAPAGSAAAVSATLVITEVQTSGPGGSTDEFVEFFNYSYAPVNVEGWQIKYAGVNGGNGAKRADLSGEIPARSFIIAAPLAFMPDADFVLSTAGISDSSGHIFIVDKNNIEIDRITWGGAVPSMGSPASAPGAGQTLQRKVDEWGVPVDTDDSAADIFSAAPTPQQGLLKEPQGPGPEEPESGGPAEEPEEPSVPPCEGGVLSEIGADFVELYNPTAAPVPLEGCRLLLDGVDYGFEPGSMLESDAYLAVQFAFDLSGLGAVTLVTADGTIEAAYPALMAGQSWALFDGVWQSTQQPTPGSANVLLFQADESPEEPGQAPGTEPAPDPPPTNPPASQPDPVPELPVPRHPCTRHGNPPRRQRSVPRSSKPHVPPRPRPAPCSARVSPQASIPSKFRR